nr:hypothetical protein [Comamonas testosteroni]
MSLHSHLRRPTRSAPADGRLCLREIWVMRWLMGLLALAMVLGPTLGQMHRAVHLGSSPGGKIYAAHSHAAPALSAASAEVAGDCQADRSNCASDLSWVHALFAGHGPAECQLLDQANHGYAGPVAVLAFSAPPPDSFIPRPFAPAPRSVFIAAPLAARAPPLSLSSLA